MGPDDIISQLVEETLGENPGHSRLVEDADLDFKLMTQLSKLPVTIFKAHYISSSLLELRVGQHALHFPKNHISPKNMSVFLKILESLVDTKLDACFVAGAGKSVWFIAWDKREAVKEDQIKRIFQQDHYQKAA